jgi:hypothetical protein
VLTRTHYWFQHEPCRYVGRKNAPWFGFIAPRFSRHRLPHRLIPRLGVRAHRRQFPQWIAGMANLALLLTAAFVFVIDRLAIVGAQEQRGDSGEAERSLSKGSTSGKSTVTTLTSQVYEIDG